MAGRTLTVYLAADTTKFKTGMAGAASSMGGIDGQITGLSNKLSSMLGPALIGAGVAAGTMAVKLGVDGVQAAIADEEAASKLAKTLENLGLAHDTAAVETMIDALQRQTGVADDELRPAFGRLVTSLGDTRLATDALKLAMDISAGTGKDLDTVVAALGKAYDGNTGALGRLGAGLDTTILKTGDMDLITQALATTFGGQAEKAASTYQGSINRLTIGFDELKESFGAGFLDGLGAADTATGDLTGTMEELQPVAELVGTTIGDQASAMLELIGYLIEAKQALDDLGDSLGPFAGFMDAAGEATGRLLNPLRSVVEVARAAINALRELGVVQSQTSFQNGPITSTGGGVFR